MDFLFHGGRESESLSLIVDYQCRFSLWVFYEGVSSSSLMFALRNYLQNPHEVIIGYAFIVDPLLKL